MAHVGGTSRATLGGGRLEVAEEGQSLLGKQTCGDIAILKADIHRAAGFITASGRGRTHIVDLERRRNSASTHVDVGARRPRMPAH